MTEESMVTLTVSPGASKEAVLAALQRLERLVEEDWPKLKKLLGGGGRLGPLDDPGDGEGF